METEARLRIDPTGIPNETLTRFRKLVTEKVLGVAPRFAEWLTVWISTEEYHRTRDPKHRPSGHLRALPILDGPNGWTNREIAQTLRGITYLSMIPMHGTLDDFLDRLVLAVSEVAADRLEKHHG